MNILYLAHRFPYPPNKGDKLRAFRHIEHLARGHRLWCASFMDDVRDQAHIPALRAICHEVAVVPLGQARALTRGAMRMTRGGTIMQGYYDSPIMRRVIRDWSQRIEFDVVIAFSSSMAPYALSMRGPRRVLDLCDLDSAKWTEYAKTSRWPMRLVYEAEGHRLGRFERSCVTRFDALTVITPAEADDLGSLMPGRVHVVTNGVDRPLVNNDRAESRFPMNQYPTIGFVGVMNYRPNVDGVRWFVEECWGRIRKANPQAVFRIVGRHPTRQVRRLGRSPGVEVVGEVADIAAELAQFDVSVAPLRIARGLQNKVLEAMAAELPVLLSEQAARGIGAVDGRDYVVAGSALSFIDRAIALLADPLERRRIGTNARRFVAANHSWPEALRRFEFIATGVIESSASAEAQTLHNPPQERDHQLTAPSEVSSFRQDDVTSNFM